VSNDQDSARLAELAPALYHNTSTLIKELDLSYTSLQDRESAEILRDILCHNKTITALSLYRSTFGRFAGAVECIADGMGSNSTLLKLNLSSCALRDGDLSTLAQTLSSEHHSTETHTRQQFHYIHWFWRASRKDATAQPCHGSRPPIQSYWERRSKSPSPVFGKQRTAKSHKPLSFWLQ
jgi:hypothetical protein